MLQGIRHDIIHRKVSIIQSTLLGQTKNKYVSSSSHALFWLPNLCVPIFMTCILKNRFKNEIRKHKYQKK